MDERHITWEPGSLSVRALERIASDALADLHHYYHGLTDQRIATLLYVATGRRFAVTSWEATEPTQQTDRGEG